ncbi:toxin-antitoxin system antitoxin component family protein [Spiribacter halobius]|uniref:Toxin-antitoxin system antitoxin component family protein n=2 Tax=Sediminicurvatus halobius TaxID=2182432 RepID=A0A2U2MX84_9GAMM|nr:toxin-antitoxin system antitoxin component family protein [Spiribacter halobius]
MKMESQSELGAELAYYLGDLESRELVALQWGDWAALHRLTEQGVAARHAARMRSRVSASVFDRCVMPRTTLQSKAPSARLSTLQSERAVRVAHIYALATRAFGDRDRGSAWLQRANAALDGNAPSDLLTNEAGARCIEQLLGRLEHGVAA